MQAWPFSFGGMTAWLALVPLLVGPRANPQEPQEGLRRVDPDSMQPGGDEAREFARAFAKDFDRTGWRERLAEPDLTRRERSFDLLLKRAGLDPLARAFLEELARDPAADELAWTARLALKQLGRVSFPLRFSLPGGDLFGAAERVQQRMEELLTRGGSAFLLAPSRGGASAPGFTASTRRSVHVEQGGTGARVRITETVDGSERTRSHEGASLEQILAANPELAQELDGLQIRAQPGTDLDLRLELGLAPARSVRGLRGFAGNLAGTPLTPQGRSRPIITDRLGVIVQPLEPARAREHGLDDQGLLVERTYPETYAQLLGVGAGSVLLELDGQVLRTSLDIEKAMRERHPDAPLRLVWIDELGQRREKTWSLQEAR